MGREDALDRLRLDADPRAASAGATNIPSALAGAEMNQQLNVIEKVRRALGRTQPLREAPVPPEVDERLVRLVHSEIGLPELFARIARENKIGVSTPHVEQLHEQLIEFLRSKNVRTIAVAGSKLLNQLEILPTLENAGFDARGWDALTLDQLYDIDCGITDVFAAVAEVGAMVIRSTAEHGRAISLVPPIHIAILEPKNFVPDLVDMFQKLPRNPGERFVFITGPSKTADIEMTLVTGVHGPGIVQAFILQ
jgi:L-lactate dehydrogenase complex protein LldG